MTPAEIISQIIQIMTGSIVGIGTAIGSGFSTLIQSIFFTGTGSDQALSMFGIMILIFAGLSLAFGLVRWTMNFLTSLGARNM